MKINRTEILLHSVKRLLRRNADVNIHRLLIKSHHAEIAAVIRQLPDEDGVSVINQIRGTEKELDTFVELEGKFIQTYLEITNDKDHIADVMHKLPEDEAAALLAEIDEDISQEILSLMKDSKKEEVKEILQYGEDTCGRIMAVNTFVLNQNLTAKEAIAEIQNSKDLESLFYIYIMDDYDKLVGVVSMRQVLQVKPSRVIKEFMSRDVIHVNVYDSQEKAANFIEDYNFVSLPVVDDEGKLVGMVTVDDVIDYIRDEADEELLQLAGVEPEAIDDFSFWRAFGSRVLWYGLLFIGGVLCSEIILYFFSKFPREIAYLCFAPLVLRLGGSTAIQSITFINQGILDKDIERSRAVRALWGQTGITLLVALLLAGSVFIYGKVRLSDNDIVPMGLALGLMAVTIFSLIIGLVIPIIFDKLKFDSLQASSRFVHFLMDALNLLVFFKFLRVWNSFMNGGL